MVVISVCFIDYTQTLVCQVKHILGLADQMARGRGTPRKMGPKTLTPFMTEICDLPYPIYDLTKNSEHYL